MPAERPRWCNMAKKKKKKQASPYLVIAVILCTAALGLAVAIALLAMAETAVPPVAESSSQAVTEESDFPSEDSREESTPGADSREETTGSDIQVSFPEEESSEEPRPEPQPGLGGEIPQFGSTRDYEYEVGLRYSVDLTPYEQYIDPEDASEYLLLVSPAAPLGRDYEPSDLIYIVDMRAGRPDYYSYLRKYAEKALEAFLDEAAMYGHGDIKVSNGYRSYAVQSTLFNNYLAEERARHPDWTEEQIYNLVATYSNPPGTSEHQSGLCVDMHNQIDTNSTFDNTPAAKWLEENCYRFGFVLRYPKDKQDVTGIKYESWHFRYVGRTAATEMHELDMCLEEYLEYKGLN